MEGKKKKRARGATSRGPNLARGVPDAGLETTSVDFEHSRGKFDADRALHVFVEGELCKATQYIALADTRVADEDEFECEIRLQNMRSSKVIFLLESQAMPRES